MYNPKKNFSKDYFFSRKRSNYFNYNFFDSDWYWRSIVSAIKKYKINGRMLDVGCALGFLLKRVRLYFSEVYGVDISSFAIKRAKKEAPSAKLDVVDIETEELPYPDKYFNLITALDFLEHTKSIEQTLAKIIKKLKDNGYLIISVPLNDTWAGKIHSILDKDLTHISIPSREELFKIINRLKLKILKKSYFLELGLFKLRGVPAFIEIILQKNS